LPLVGGLVAVTPTSTIRCSVCASHKPISNSSDPCSKGCFGSGAAAGRSVSSIAAWGRGRLPRAGYSRVGRKARPGHKHRDHSRLLFALRMPQGPDIRAWTVGRFHLRIHRSKLFPTSEANHVRPDREGQLTRRSRGGASSAALARACSPRCSGRRLPPRSWRNSKSEFAQAKSAAAPFGTRLIFLGTAGGPTYWTNTSRRSTSSALVVGDAIYLVDCGDGAGKRLQEALEVRPRRRLRPSWRLVGTRSHVVGDFLQPARDREIASDPFSAIMIVAGWILEDGIAGMTDASATRKPSKPRTRNSGSTTAVSSCPIRQVPQG
jgi:hypothetical protein